ncbi:Uncharacterised protein [Vibrio cholerae]|uniref:Uncharacterized protein n=1 Tax=Vibrio cholerae TaxID=666 RepID=A0A655ZRS6_VIBCL|nr:Uncharacterised protein [Vibrio cholerae]
MVLRGDHHHTAIQIFHWMVCTMVTELHFYCFRAGGECQNLVT